MDLEQRCRFVETHPLFHTLLTVQEQCVFKGTRRLIRERGDSTRRPSDQFVDRMYERLREWKEVPTQNPPTHE
jgi:hypothetical protein